MMLAQITDDRDVSHYGGKQDVSLTRVLCILYT